MNRNKNWIIGAVFALVLGSFGIIGPRHMSKADAMKTGGLKDLSDHQEFIIDESHSLNIESVLKVNDQTPKWQSRDHSFGLTNASIWSRASFVTHKSSSKFILAIDHIYLSHLQMWIVDAQGEGQGRIVGQSETGLAYKIPENDEDFSGFALSFELLPDHAYWVISRVESIFPINLPLHLYEENAFRDEQITYRAIIWLYIGVIMALGIYNLFIFFVTRDMSYLWYVVCLVDLHLFSTLSQFGVYRHSLGSYAPAFSATLYHLTYPATAVTIFLFFNRVMNLEQTSKICQKISLGFIGVAFGIYILSALNYHLIADQLSQLNATFFTIYLLYWSYRLYRRGVRHAIFFFIGWSSLLAFWILNFLRIDGIIPPSAISNYSLLFGCMIEGILLALALADRLSVLNEEKALADRRSLAAQLNAEKYQTIASVTQMLAHDVRKPFSILSAVLDSFDHSGNRADESGAEVKKRLLPAAQEVQRCLVEVDHMTADIMALGGEARRDSAQSIAIEGVIAIGLKDAFGSGQKKSAHLQFDWRHRHHILGSPNRLARVFANIFDNALSATKDKGKIWVKTLPGADINANTVTIIIGNSDSFIDVQDRLKIFEPFYTQGKRQGTGLGLTIVQQIIREHGGDVICSSVEGVGTEFLIHLPVTGNAYKPTQLPEGGSTLDYAIKTSDEPTINKAELTEFGEHDLVMIVDDNPFILTAWEHQLGKANTRLVASPADALDILSTDADLCTRLKCIIIDYNFDDIANNRMNGKDLAEEIRKMVKTPIFLSSDLPITKEITVLFDRVLPKRPIPMAQLLKMI